MIFCVDTIPTNHVPNLSISSHHGKIWSIKISLKMSRTSPIWTSSERLMYNQFTSCVCWAEVLMYIQLIYTLFYNYLLLPNIINSWERWTYWNNLQAYNQFGQVQEIVSEAFMPAFQYDIRSALDVILCWQRRF